ncbi:MAG TPA: response regulator [Chitinispirillaceae bacterium]|nr:response regulator [Chitinispirillaceae bacterium]
MATMFHVLIIDDDADLREILRKSLTRLGCNVTVAETAEKGLDILKLGQYNAVFAALCVRNMGGRSIARWVKQQSSDTKFFLVTSWRGDLEHSLLKLDGIHDVVHKPINFSEIRDKVLEHLG